MEQELDTITLTNIARAVKNGELDAIPAYLSVKDREYVKEALQLLYSTDKAIKIWYVQKEYIETAAAAAQSRAEALERANAYGKLEFEYEEARNSAYELAVANNAQYNKLERTLDKAAAAMQKQLLSRGGTPQEVQKVFDWAFRTNVAQFTGTFAELEKELLVMKPSATGARKCVINQFLYRWDELMPEFDKLGTIAWAGKKDEWLENKVNDWGHESNIARGEAEWLGDRADFLQKQGQIMSKFYILDCLGQMLQELGRNLAY